MRGEGCEEFHAGLRSPGLGLHRPPRTPLLWSLPLEDGLGLRAKPCEPEIASRWVPKRSRGVQLFKALSVPAIKVGLLKYFGEKLHREAPYLFPWGGGKAPGKRLVFKDSRRGKDSALINDCSDSCRRSWNATHILHITSRLALRHT